MLIAFIEVRFPRLWMPMALYVPLGILITLISLSSHPRALGEVMGFIVIGIVSWTLIEYVLHRFVFHESKLKEPWRNLTSAFHLSHHQAVAVHEADIVITRPAGSVPFAIFFYFLFSLVTWSFSAGALIEVGAFIGYLAYEGVHYGVHHFTPKTQLGQFLKTYHFQHHLHCPKSRFGVTSPFWDVVFGTYYAKPKRT